MLIPLVKNDIDSDCVQIQSTFMLDLQQISLLLKFCTRRSLIIIDEFGKGTDLNGESNAF
jgi:DNA mismatch repair ATPase MutS